MSMVGGVQPVASRIQADQTIISRAITAKLDGSFDIRLRWKCVSASRICFMPCARLTIATVCSRVMPHFVLSLCSLSVPGPCMATPFSLRQRLEVELQADADIGRPAHVAADSVDAVELVLGIDIDAEPVLDRHLELFGLLVRAVQHQRLGIGAGEQREIHLVDAEAIAAGAFLVHDVADRQAVARLVGEQDLDVRVVIAKRIAELRDRYSGTAIPR